MRSKEQLRAILEEARELEVPEVIVDGVTYNLERKVPKIAPKYVEDLKPEEIIQPLSPLDELTEEEIMYWSSGYYDELQAKKQEQQNQKKQDDELRQAKG